MSSSAALKPLVLFNPYVRDTHSTNPNYINFGHKVLDASEHIAHDIELMASVFFAAHYGSYIIGCGSSGVSQFLAQLLAAKYRMDPNELSLFEDDWEMRKLLPETAT